MIIFRKKYFSIYSRLSDNNILIECNNGPIKLVKSNLEEVKSVLNIKSEDKRVNTEKILVFDAFVDNNKIGIIQLSENDPIEVELDWIGLLKDNNDSYLLSIISYFLNLSVSSKYRRFILGIYKGSDDTLNNCIGLGFLTNTIEQYNNVIKLIKPL